MGTLQPGSSGAALTPGFVHDVKIFHQNLEERSRPQPAQVALLVGGRGIGKLIPGLRGRGKQFVIADVTGASVALTRHTGPTARLTLDVVPTCRAHPHARYWIRASAVIRGRLRKVYSRGDCSWVMQVLAHDSRALNRTTFVFEN